MSEITVTKIGGALGAEIGGVDISKKLDDATVKGIHQALLDHLVIFFRDQELTDDDLIRFGKNFGELAPLPPHRQNPGMYPEILVVEKKPEDTVNFGYEWHSDTTHLPIPPMGSILYAMEVPEHGGDTLFANQYLAYDTLSEGLRETLDGMNAVHGNGRILRVLESGTLPVYGQEAVSAAHSTDRSSHPIVRTHPETGKKALYVNIAHTESIEGMDVLECQPFLHTLFRHSTQNPPPCRFQWRKGSVAFWDNRCCQHLALNDYPGEHRLMHRVQVKGTKPV